jgi:hypothetical protein
MQSKGEPIKFEAALKEGCPTSVKLQFQCSFNFGELKAKSHLPSNIPVRLVIRQSVGVGFQKAWAG